MSDQFQYSSILQFGEFDSTSFGIICLLF